MQNRQPTLRLLLSLPSPPTGGLLSTTSCAHEGGGSVEPRDSGEELSTPTVKRKCVHSEDRVSLTSVLGVCRKIYTWMACYAVSFSVPLFWGHLSCAQRLAPRYFAYCIAGNFCGAFLKQSSHQLQCWSINA